MPKPFDPTDSLDPEADHRQRVKLSPEASRRLAGQEAGQDDSSGPRMLPGMAMIAIFMLVISMANAFQVLRHADAFRPSARYAILTLCSAIVLGVFGFLRLRRWGWALLLGGTFFYAAGNMVLFAQSRQFGYLMPAAFSLVFFLYLVRDEIRIRMK